MDKLDFSLKLQMQCRFKFGKLWRMNELFPPHVQLVVHSGDTARKRTKDCERSMPL